MQKLLVLSFFMAVAAVQNFHKEMEMVHVVVFHANSSPMDRSKHFDRFQMNVQHRYSIGTFNGYAAAMNQSTVQAVLASPEVAYLEQDREVHAFQFCHEQKDATWGLDRVAERALNLDEIYKYHATGEGVNSYIVDTGIYLGNVDFEGRAVFGANFIPNENGDDCNGHGTHVAGTVGGATWGVAKKTTLVAVKVLGCTGSGSYAGVIGGVDFVASDSVTRKGRAVANMSLGGPIYKALNDAITAAVEAGVVFVVAAGNENQDACNVSPASTAAAITVGATTVSAGANNEFDARSSFSNYGKCVDIFAPGSLITGPWIGAPTATRTISGTSMASPHVCGGAALYLQAHPEAPAKDVNRALADFATPDAITLNCLNAACRLSPNKMLFTGACHA